MCEESIQSDYNFEEVRPVLRPLGDMTEKEESELENILLPGSYVYNSHHKILKDVHSAERIRILLKMRFDLFGLIENNEAIDATLIK